MALDEIEAAHASVGGTGPGRRYATQQINQAYALLIASQFQGFCHDLHTESGLHRFDEVSHGAEPNLTLQQIRHWRSVCRRLARSFDEVMRVYLESLTGGTPWPK